jgi:redox-sensitive bicupin YhaK (pirin superfamily)
MMVGRDDSVAIHQDAKVYTANLDENTKITLPVDVDRHVWVQVVQGKVNIGEKTLNSGDGAAISEETRVTFTGLDQSEILVFDLA